MAEQHSRRCVPPLWRALVAFTALCVFGAACGANPLPRACTEVRFAAGVEADWARAARALDFAPTRSCAHDGGLRVAAVFVDAMPADSGFVPRINQAVDRDGTRVFVFTEGRAPVPFRAIPQGTRPLRVTLPASDEQPSGFVGASAGTDIAYLRWRDEGVTREVAATLSPVFTERDLIELVRGTAAQARAQP